MNLKLASVFILLASVLSSCRNSCINSLNMLGTDDLGSGFYYTDGCDILGDKVFSKTRNTEEWLNIPPRIIAYKYDKNYIIAKQNLGGKWPQVEYAFFNSDGQLLESEEVFTNGWDCNYYWLIIKPSKLVYGPIDSLEFYKLIDSYQIPLRFDN